MQVEFNNFMLLFWGYVISCLLSIHMFPKTVVVCVVWFFSPRFKRYSRNKFVELYKAFIFSIKDCGIFFVQLGRIAMMASDEVWKCLKWKRLIMYEIFSYRTSKALTTGEKLLKTFRMRYRESWKANRIFIALISADVLPICLLRRMSAALRLRKSCSRRWKVPFQLLQRDFLGTCRM